MTEINRIIKQINPKSGIRDKQRFKIDVGIWGELLPKLVQKAWMTIFWNQEKWVGNNGHQNYVLVTIAIKAIITIVVMTKFRGGRRGITGLGIAHQL